MPVLSAQQLRTLLQHHLLRVDTPADTARQVADNLVEASLKGHDSHGVTLLPRYIQAIEAGDLNPRGELRLLRDEGALLSFHGQRGFGQVLGQKAMEAGIQRARDYGVAIIGIAEAHHLGRIGAWAEQVAEAGLVSLHFANVSAPSAVLPFGGQQPRLGTNPLCVGIPRAKGDPVILDFATSAIAGNKARIAWNEGRPLPEGCAVDHLGNPTTDAGSLMQEPRGSLLAFGGHKGAGLSLICTLLGAALTGGQTESHRFPPRPGIINNMLSILIDPLRLGAGEQYQQEVEAQLAWIHSSGGEAQIPGEPEARHYARRSVEGISVDAVSWQQFIDLDPARPL
ncbi:MAG TPA: malate/lactate/ureidoglycolate dehydrogenase [Enterobacteriaceae bacterium]|nr:malate/lactate/ureidoglycolate dehydrogenase [Enterobacteriaceae bacterium]